MALALVLLMYITAIDDVSYLKPCCPATMLCFHVQSLSHLDTEVQIIHIFCCGFINAKCIYNFRLNLDSIIVYP